MFAPTNEAFANLEQVAPGYFAQLQSPDFSLHLFNLIGYHVTAGTITTDSFPISGLEMFREGTIDISDTGVIQSVSPNVAQVLEPADSQASNGIVQVIDNVLLPQFVADNLLSALQARPGMFSTFLQLIEASGFADNIAGLSGVTLLAPTNDAIRDDTVEFLLADGNEAVLERTVTYHIIDSIFNCAIQSVPNILLRGTVQGENIVVGLIFDDNNPGDILVSFNSATRQGEILTQQNIIYPIDTILVPPTNSTLVPRSVGKFNLEVLTSSFNPPAEEATFVQQSSSSLNAMDIKEMVSFVYSSWRDWEVSAQSADASFRSVESPQEPAGSLVRFMESLWFRMSSWYEG